MHNTHHVARHSHDSDAASVASIRVAARDFDVEAQSRNHATNNDKHVQIIDPPKKPSLDIPNDEAAMYRRRTRTDSVGNSSFKSTLRRRGRAETANVSYSATEMGRTSGWTPGQEPGFDPRKMDQADEGNFGEMTQLCEITCVDYSTDNLAMVNLDNTNIREHMQKPKPEWAQVRWINVNGLSQDVVGVIGRYKGLHPLALEDLMNTRSRTKADWYNDHSFIVLPLQRLVHLDMEDDSSDSDDSSSDEDLKNDGPDKSDTQQDCEKKTETHFMSERERRRQEAKLKKKRKGAIRTLITDIFRPRSKKAKKSRQRDSLTPTNSFNASNKVVAPWLPRNARSLQRYHAGPNQDRIAYFERNAVLLTRGLSVSMEQVSIFLTADNTVISFFEYSAADVEKPILRRLQTEGTIMRESADASMLMQSIIDAIIDLAIPVTSAYQDALGDLELEVLTDPAISESKTLYILISEIAVLRNAIAPVAQLMSALKDHKSKGEIVVAVPSRGLAPLPDGTTTTTTNNTSSNTAPRPGNTRRSSYFPSAHSVGVTISPLTVTYLGDVEDHCLLIQDSYDQMRRSADNLVDLIFNTVSAYQNDSMKQLTLVTCFFLPLSFMTGYFGMNFTEFSALHQSDSYFWEIAAPVSAVVLILLLRDAITRKVVSLANKALISRVRKRRLERGA